MQARTSSPRRYEVLEKEPHFEPDFRFRQNEVDPVTQKPVLRLVAVPDHPAKGRDVIAKLTRAAAKGVDRQLVTSMGDLLKQCLHLDPARRPSVKEVLQHPFISPPSPVPGASRDPSPVPNAPAAVGGGAAAGGDMFA